MINYVRAPQSLLIKSAAPLIKNRNLLIKSGQNLIKKRLVDQLVFAAIYSISARAFGDPGLLINLVAPVDPKPKPLINKLAPLGPGEKPLDQLRARP